MSRRLLVVPMHETTTATECGACPMQDWADPDSAAYAHGDRDGRCSAFGGSLGESSPMRLPACLAAEEADPDSVAMLASHEERERILRAVDKHTPPSMQLGSVSRLVRDLLAHACGVRATEAFPRAAGYHEGYFDGRAHRIQSQERATRETARAEAALTDRDFGDEGGRP